MPVDARRAAPRPALSAVLALIPSLVVVLALHRHVFRGLVPTKLSTLYSHDQLGYLAIVTNVARGHSAGLEPDTMSGQNPYPSGYYIAVGTVARVLHLQPVTAWNLVSMLLQIVAFTLLGIAVATIAHRAWTAILGALVPLTGAAASLVAGSWMIPINHQGALWGPFGVLFPMNGETAGLCAIIMGISLVALAWARPDVPRQPRTALTVSGVLLLGIAANFQTYSFLTGTYVVGVVLVTIALLRDRAWRTAMVSVALLLVVVLFGPLVAHIAGSLAALGFGVLPMLPGALVLVRRGSWRVLTYPILYALAAAPMILSTLEARDTPFMRYRVTSNVALGVAKWETLAASGPLLLIMAGIVVLGLRRHNAVVSGIGIGFPIAWALVSLNDCWGANAEPYRFWIDAYLLGLVLALIAFAACWGSPDANTVRHAGKDLVIGSVVVALAWTLSLGDARLFLCDTNVAATWDPGSADSHDIVQAVGDIEPHDGRLWTTNCTDIRTVKVLTGAPVSYYHLGMAWPDDREAVDLAMQAANERRIDVSVLREAGVHWVLTRNGCDPTPPESLVEVRTAGDVTLWQVRGDASA